MGETLKYLTWDSHFFGKRVGRLEIQANEALDEALKHSNLNGFELLYIYSPVAIETALHDQYSLIDVGGHVAFVKDISGYSLKDNRIAKEIEEYKEGSFTPQLLELAFLSGHLSRFRIDPYLPIGSFEKLYEQWLKNTIDNRPKTTIYTYQLGWTVAGLVTATWGDYGCRIDLLGVLRQYQGRGIASKLIEHVTKICTTRNTSSLEVKTQLSNRAAQAVYLKNSFTERNRSFLYHAHHI